MQEKSSDPVSAALIAMMTRRLRQLHTIGTAADACVSAGNYESAFRVLLDVEQHAHELTTLLNAASLLRREADA